MILLHELKHRVNLPTPAFWRKIRARCLATSAGFTTLTITLASLSTHLPSSLAVLTTISAVAAAFFGGIGTVCGLAVDDPTQIPPAPAAPAAPVAEAGLAPETE
jgi:hypothetical protein